MSKKYDELVNLLIKWFIVGVIVWIFSMIVMFTIGIMFPMAVMFVWVAGVAVFILFFMKLLKWAGKYRII